MIHTPQKAQFTPWATLTKLRARSGSQSPEGVTLKVDFPWEIGDESRCIWTLSMSGSKLRRDLTKLRSGRPSKSARTTISGSILLYGKHFLWQKAFTVYWQGVISEKLLGFGALHFDPQAVEKSFSTSTEGPWPCAEPNVYFVLYFCSKAKYTVYSVHLVAGGSNTRPRCILCICFKLKYTVYLAYLQVCMCVFPI